MNQFKRAQVVILPTKESTRLSINKFGLLIQTRTRQVMKIYNNQHLYIISDDEIKEDDWVIDATSKIRKVININKDYRLSLSDIPFLTILSSSCKKIIATIDTSLNLSQPSQQFIEKYIEEYNKGNVIKDVLVEYENYEMTSIANHRGNYDFKCPNCKYSIDDLMFSKQSTLCNQCNKLKINPKDNTITIKKLKDTWNREEIFELLKKAYLQGRSDGHCTFRVEELGFENWIKENL